MSQQQQTIVHMLWLHFLVFMMWHFLSLGNRGCDLQLFHDHGGGDRLHRGGRARWLEHGPGRQRAAREAPPPVAPPPAQQEQLEGPQESSGPQRPGPPPSTSGGAEARRPPLLLAGRVPQGHACDHAAALSPPQHQQLLFGAAVWPL